MQMQEELQSKLRIELELEYPPFHAIVNGKLPR